MSKVMNEISIEHAWDSEEVQAIAEHMQLKCFKEYKELSEETLAFHAKLYIGGVHVADVKNEGHGGPTMAQSPAWAWKETDLMTPRQAKRHNRLKEQAKSLLKDADDELEKLVWIAGTCTWSVDEVCSYLAQEESDRRYYKSMGKRSIMYSLHSDQEDTDDTPLPPCTPDASPQVGIFRKLKRTLLNDEGLKYEEALTIKLILKEHGEDVRMVFGLRSPADSQYHISQDIGLVNGGGAVLQGHESLGYVYYPAPSTK